MLSDFSKNACGLDISENTLRFIKLKKSGSNLVITSFNEMPLESGLIVNGEIINQEKVSAAINKLIKSANGSKVKTKNIITVLPEAKTFVKVINVTAGEKEKNYEQMIKEEIKNHIPLSLEEIYLDWAILKQNNGTLTVLVGATPKGIADTYVNTVKKSGFIPLALEIEAIAISRAIINEKKEKKESNKAKIIIDFGAVRTGLSVFDHHTVQFTVSLPISGNKITETIAKTLNIDAKKAEKSKLVCGLDPEKCEGALLKILMASINNLATNIKKSVLYYKTNYPKGNEISEVILSGGGANFVGIDKVLSEKLKLPVTIGDPLTNLGKQKKLKMPDNKLKSYTTAIGLALRSWQKGKLI